MMRDPLCRSQQRTLALVFFRGSGRAVIEKNPPPSGRSSPRLPSSGVSSHMHAADYNDDVAVNSVENPVGEPIHQDSSDIPVDYGEPLGMMGYNVYGGAKCLEEFVTEPGTLPFVPDVCVVNVRGRPRTDDDRHQPMRLRMRFSTSSNGMPTGPSRSISSSRRSSSSRCGLVSGTASGVRERLSHSASNSRSRSSAFRPDMSMDDMKTNIHLSTRCRTASMRSIPSELFLLSVLRFKCSLVLRFRGRAGEGAHADEVIP
jgi:hypothetical protein